jgi:hypothetical protein
VKLKTIVPVLDSLSTATDAALSRALSLAQWYESDLHVVHVPPSSRVIDGIGNAIHDDIAERITAVAEASGIDGVNVIPAVLSGSPVRAIVDYADRGLSRSRRCREESTARQRLPVGGLLRGMGGIRGGTDGAHSPSSRRITCASRTGPATMSLVRPADQDDLHVATHAGTFGLSAGIEPDRAREGGLSWQ